MLYQKVPWRILGLRHSDAPENLVSQEVPRSIYSLFIRERCHYTHQDTVSSPRIEEREQIRIRTFVESEYFTVYKWDVQGKATFWFNDHYLLLSVIKGNGELIHDGESYSLKKGMHLLFQWNLEVLK